MAGAAVKARTAVAGRLLLTVGSRVAGRAGAGEGAGGQGQAGATVLAGSRGAGVRVLAVQAHETLQAGAGIIAACQHALHAADPSTLATFAVFAARIAGAGVPCLAPVADEAFAAAASEVAARLVARASVQARLRATRSAELAVDAGEAACALAHIAAGGVDACGPVLAGVVTAAGVHQVAAVAGVAALAQAAERAIRVDLAGAAVHAGLQGVAQVKVATRQARVIAAAVADVANASCRGRADTSIEAGIGRAKVAGLTRGAAPASRALTDKGGTPRVTDTTVTARRRSTGCHDLASVSRVGVCTEAPVNAQNLSWIEHISEQKHLKKSYITSF